MRVWTKFICAKTADDISMCQLGSGTTWRTPAMITCQTYISPNTTFTPSPNRYWSTKVLCCSVNTLKQSTWVMKSNLLLWHLCSDFNGFHMTYHCLHRYPAKTLNASCRVPQWLNRFVLHVSNTLHPECGMRISAPAVKAHLCLIRCFLPAAGGARTEVSNKEDPALV